MRADATPWRALLAAGAALGIAPRHFWRLSLKEWRAIAAPLMGAEAMPRQDFDALSERFPDHAHDKY